MPRRKRRGDHRSLSPRELSFQDSLKADRDKLAAKIDLDATLIANRAQLAQIARSPETMGDLMLPWQCELIASLPAYQNGPA